jgi:hypothetical protein
MSIPFFARPTLWSSRQKTSRRRCGAEQQLVRERTPPTSLDE